MNEPATPTADDRRQIRDRYLACLETQDSDDARNFVVAVLTAGIQAGASQIIADRVRWRIRIRFQQDGELVEHVRLPAKYWSGLRDALCSLAGINPSASAWPQQGQVQVQGVALAVTIDEVKGRETVLITIPPQQTASPRSSTARRKRFWT